MSKPVFVQSDIRIKCYEIDAMGIVNNIVYVKWFEDLRHVLMDQYYPYADMIREKKSPILMKTEVEYLRPLTIADFPVGKVWFHILGRTKWRINFEICSGDIVYCKGIQTGCFYDIEINKPTPFPDWFLERFAD